MTADDRTATTPADQQPTENLGTTATAVLSAPDDVQGRRPEQSPSTDQPYGTPPTAPYGSSADSSATSGAPYAAAPYAGAPAPTNPLSLTSLILGVTSVFFGLTVIAPVAGLVLGLLGLRREPAGRTLAIWGIILNSVMLGVVVLMAMALLAFGLLVPFLAIVSEAAAS